MFTCPVCQTKGSAVPCPICGFDRSADFEHFPTLALCHTPPVSISVLRAERDVLRCVHCGGSLWGFRTKTRTCFCTGCGKPLPTASLTKLLGIHSFSPVPLPPISTGGNHIVRLLHNGTVLAVGNSSYNKTHVSKWHDITAITSGFNMTLGLTSQGSVLFAGYDGKTVQQGFVPGWTDMVSIAAGAAHYVGLHADGTVAVVNNDAKATHDVSTWTGIRAVAAGHWHTVGLKSDSTVVSTGRETERRRNDLDWIGITAIACGGYHTVGLRANGKVVVQGCTFRHQNAVSNWSDIVAVAANDAYTFGLRRDGTVVSADDSGSRISALSRWKNVRAIAAGGNYIVGLDHDGHILSYPALSQADIDMLTP